MAARPQGQGPEQEHGQNHNASWQIVAIVADLPGFQAVRSRTAAEPLLQPRLAMTRAQRWTNSVSIALAIVFGFSGMAKLLGAELMRERFAAWGYPDVFMLVVGMLEVAGAIGLLIPRIASLAAIGLAMLMAGSVYTLLFRDFAPLAAVPLVFFAALLFIARRRLNAPQAWVLSPQASTSLPRARGGN
jgi:putative oxidoreductase